MVQPLIAENTQYFPYLYESRWKRNTNAKIRKVIAATVGLVEQQVPMFNTKFFSWYMYLRFIYTNYLLS